MFYTDTSRNPPRPRLSVGGIDHLDLFTGLLKIHTTDVSVPGNGGLTLALTRHHRPASSQFFRQYNSTVPALHLGVDDGGWQLNLGVLYGGNRCHTPDGPNYNGVTFVTPGGDSIRLYCRRANSAEFRSRDNWRAVCTSTGYNARWTIDAPRGLRLTLNPVPSSLYGRGNVPLTRPTVVTRLSDPSGNNLNVSYRKITAPVSGGSLSRIGINKITASDGRSATFRYAVIGGAWPRLIGITSEGRTWSFDFYVYPGLIGTDKNRAARLTILKSVTRPDDKRWFYRYAFGSCENCLRSVTYPHGGTLTFQYDSNRTSELATAGPDVTPGTWRVRYDRKMATPGDAATVRWPNNQGKTIYRFWDTKEANAYGRVGAVKEIETCADVVNSNTCAAGPHCWTCARSPATTAAGAAAFSSTRRTSTPSATRLRSTNSAPTARVVVTNTPITPTPAAPCGSFLKSSPKPPTASPAPAAAPGAPAPPPAGMTSAARSTAAVGWREKTVSATSPVTPTPPRATSPPSKTPTARPAGGSVGTAATTAAPPAPKPTPPNLTRPLRSSAASTPPAP